MAAGAAVALIATGAAGAQEPATGSPAVLQRLLECRNQADAAARLACYDAAAASMAEAERSGEVVVIGKEQARAARRQAFGFDLPALSFFNRGEKAEELERISAKVANAYRDADGKWTVELEGGAVWRQTDMELLARPPRSGSTAEIRRAALGSFFMNLDGQRAVRARRVR